MVSYRDIQDIAETSGYTLGINAESILNKVRQGGGSCPCDKNTRCPCPSMVAQVESKGHCKCGMFTKGVL